MLVTTQSLFNKWMYLLVIFAAAVTEVLSDSCNCWCLIDGLWVCLTRCKTISTVQMISAEAPVLFAKAAQIFITELTLRAWIHTEDNKRRTLQVIDISFSLYLNSSIWHVFFVILSKSYFKWIGPPDTHTAQVVIPTLPHSDINWLSFWFRASYSLSASVSVHVQAETLYQHPLEDCLSVKFLLPPFTLKANPGGCRWPTFPLVPFSILCCTRAE